MSWLEVFLTVMSSLVGMELFAWVAHKYIMHGWGWGWHRDHHEPHDNLLEKNDLFGLFGAATLHPSTTRATEAAGTALDDEQAALRGGHGERGIADVGRGAHHREGGHCGDGEFSCIHRVLLKRKSKT